MPTLVLIATAAPTGRDWFQVKTYDALWGYKNPGEVDDPTPHVSPGTMAEGTKVDERVELKVDHTPPTISLSGPATEQEAIGTTASDDPLNIAVTDGEDGAPQSGVV